MESRYDDFHALLSGFMGATEAFRCQKILFFGVAIPGGAS